MRILFVTGEFPPMQGGVGDCTSEIARALVPLGVEPFVLTAALRGTPAVAVENGITVRREARGWGWSAIPLIARLARQTGADLVHIQYQTAAFGMHPAINLAPRLLRSVPFVVTFHDLRVPYIFPKAGKMRDWITFELARSAAAAAATNEEDYVRLRQKAISRATLLPIGSNISPTLPPGYDRAGWRADHGIPGEVLLLSYFGFLNESKGGETLIRALSLVPQARLMMVGGAVGASDPTNAAYLTRVKSLIAQLGVGGRVMWTDHMPTIEVSAALSSSDICVLPYRDGASFRRGTLMAALAHGLPIITTSPRGAISGHAAGKGGAAALPRLCDGENVLLVPPDDPAALAAAMDRLGADAALRVRLGRGARELSLAFTWDKIAAEHLALYREIARG